MWWISRSYPWFSLLNTAVWQFFLISSRSILFKKHALFYSAVNTFLHLQSSLTDIATNCIAILLSIWRSFQAHCDSHIKIILPSYYWSLIHSDLPLCFAYKYIIMNCKYTLTLSDLVKLLTIFFKAINVWGYPYKPMV